MKRISKTGIVCLAVVMGLGILLSVPSTAQAKATESQKGKYMYNYLKACKKGEFSKAKKWSKKLPKYASKETCVANMPKTMKKAYLKAAKKKGYSGVYFTDIDKDGTPEMVSAPYNAGGTSYVLTYRKNKVVNCGAAAIDYNWAGFYYYPKHNGIVVHWRHESFGIDTVQLITLKGTTAKLKTIKRVDPAKKTIPVPRNLLKDVAVDE